MMRFAPVASALVVLAVACQSSPVGDALGSRPLDGGVDAADGGARVVPPDASIDPALGGPCTDDRQCDDAVVQRVAEYAKLRK